MRKVIFGILFLALLTGGAAAAALVDNGNDTVTDTETELMWQKATAPGIYTWQQALAYAEGLLLNGHSDWRLPNRNELQTLVDYSRSGRAIDPLLVANTMSSGYWSSTTYAHLTSYAWRVDFSYGHVYGYGKFSSCFVRAVRAEQSGSLGDSVILGGKVIARDTRGNILGPLMGAEVAIDGGSSKTTDNLGGFTFQDLTPGSIKLTVTKSGYYPATSQFMIRAGDNNQKTIYITQQPAQSTTKPSVIGFDSPFGLHFISGMPGDLGLEAMVAWNGLPGTVRFLVGGEWFSATMQDIGGGQARATISIQIPTILANISVVLIEVTNSEGQTTISPTGVFFYPVPALLNMISDILPSWTLTGRTYSSDTEISVPFWKKEIPSGVLESEASLGYRQKIAFDTLSGDFVIGLNGFVEMSTKLDFADVENLTGARGDYTATLTYFFRGESAPKVQGNLELAGTLKSGVGAPAVYTMKLFPPAVPVVDTLLAVPVVKDILKALKLRLYLIGGLGFNGTWGENQNCWLGTETIGGSFTLGAEIQALVEKWGAELGVYAGGTAMSFKII